MSPDGSPGSGGGYKGGMSSCNYPQTKVDQTPRYDNQMKKRRKKKKKHDQ